jgi:hypothetical protein
MSRYHFLVLILILTSFDSFSQKKESNVKQIGYPTQFSISRPLRELFTTDDLNEQVQRTVEMEDRDRRFTQIFRYTTADGIEFGDDLQVR